MSRPVTRRLVSRQIKAAVLVLAAAAAAAGCATRGTATGAARGSAGSAQVAAAHGGTVSHSGTVSHGGAAAQACDPAASSLAPDGPAAVTSGSFAAAIKARGKLIAGVDQSTYHFGFLNPVDNKVEGFDIAMVDEVAKAIFGGSEASYTSKIVFKAIPDANRISALQSGAVDIVAHTMTITCDRLQKIDFSSVYYDAQQKLLVLKGSKAQSLADLKGQKVCATDGSTSVDTIKRFGAIPVQVTYWTDCLVDLQQGQVSGVSTDDSILQGLAAQDPFTQIVGGSLEDEPYGLGIAKQHPDFVRFVNAVLAQAESDGQWESDYKKWVSPAGHAVPVPHYAS